MKKTEGMGALNYSHGHLGDVKSFSLFTRLQYLNSGTFHSI